MAYRQSDAYTRELERRLGEAEKECSRLAERIAFDEHWIEQDVRSRLFRRWGWFPVAALVFSGLFMLVGTMAWADVHGECEPERTVLICAEPDGSCVEMVEGER